MKSFFLSLFLLVSTLTSFAQSAKIHYLRAHNVSMGVRVDEDSPVTSWPVDGEEVNILIELHPTKIKIFSKKEQNYFIINKVSQTDTEHVWLCKNLDGLSCYIRMQTNPQYPGLMTVAVEFNDLVWFYVCSHESN